MTDMLQRPDWRGLCEELSNTLERAQKALRFEGGCSDATDNKRRALIDRARAALSQPEPEVVGPSDEELLALMPETMRDEFSYAAKVCSDATGGQVKPRIFRVCLNTAALEYARAVLSRWGRPAPTPAEGDPPVDLIIAAYRSGVNDARVTTEQIMAEAERQAAPVPVAGWQPISTAPKDGTEILASDYDAIDIVSYHFPPGEPPGWFNRDDQWMAPSWWQPLADHPDLPLPSGEVEA